MKRVVPPALRILLARLFGASSALAKRTELSDSEWRRVLKALLAELYAYQIANLRTDEFHEVVLASGLASAHGSLSEVDFWPGYVEGIVRYALTLIGDYPDHRRRKPGRKKADHYDLTLRRSVTYPQSADQQYRTLWAAVDLGILGTKDKMWVLMDPFLSASDGNASSREKLDWFRSTYPAIYARAFP